MNRCVVQLSEVIRLRRAVRAYTGQKVDEKTIRALLDAAIQAPSAMNAQPWCSGLTLYALATCMPDERSACLTSPARM